jgi:hypothetical protein
MKTVEIDVDLLKKVLMIARNALLPLESDYVQQAEMVLREYNEKSRPSNLDHLFNGPGYFSGKPVDTEENLE